MRKHGIKEEAVVLDRVSKTLGEGATAVCALSDVSLAVGKGEFVVVMGPSGSGKSTLLQLMGGLDRPSHGRIYIDGMDLASLGEDAVTRLRRTRIGFVFQFFHLLPMLTAEENVALPLLLDGCSISASRRRSQAALNRVGIGVRARHKPEQLSGGEKQRVAVARAVAIKPALVLADEPTGNLDSTSAAQTMKLLRRINSEDNCAVVLVTHNESMACAGDRIIRLQDGKVSEPDPRGGVRQRRRL